MVEVEGSSSGLKKQYACRGKKISGSEEPKTAKKSLRVAENSGTAVQGSYGEPTY
jgi:hypothetical protein